METNSIQFSHAALENIAETGCDPIYDIARLRGGMTGHELLDMCLGGADADRHQGWVDYVNALEAHLGMENTTENYGLDWSICTDAKINAALAAEFGTYNTESDEDRANGLDACRELLAANLPENRTGHFDAETITWESDIDV